jgi:hypothetical protein
LKVSIEVELSLLRKITAGISQGSVLAPVLYSLNINDAPAVPGVHLAVFADDTNSSMASLLWVHGGVSVGT